MIFNSASSRASMFSLIVDNVLSLVLTEELCTFFARTGFNCSHVLCSDIHGPNRLF